MSNLSLDSGVTPEPTLFDLHAEHTKLVREVRQKPAGIAAMEDDVRRFVFRAKEAGAYLFENEQRVAAQGLIDFWTTTLYRASIPCDEVELAEFNTSRAPDIECPYVGLEAFGESQSRFFFGREQTLNDAIEKLRAGRSLIALLGPSGSGKSSVMLAGLLRRLKVGTGLPGSASRRYLPSFVPGSDPLKALAVAVSEGDRLSVDKIAQRFRGHWDALAKIAALESRPMVVTIDQFEELFTLCDDEEARDAFAANLVSLVNSGGGHIVITTMRDDRELHLAKYPALRELFKKGDVRVMAMTRAELCETIEQPAREVHLRLEQGLADAIANDLVAEPAALPLLQFTLRKLWESRAGNWLRLSTYRRLGGGRAALGNAAHELFESLTVESRQTLRRVMLRMVRPGLHEDTTSSRVRVSDLMKIPHANPSGVKYVLDKLLEARLIRRTSGETPDDDQVEVAHEALIRNWPELVAWIQEARADLVDLRRLEGLADQWDRRGRIGGLLDEKELAEVETWLNDNDASDLGVKPSLYDLVDLSRARIAEQQTAERHAHMWRLALVVLLFAALVTSAVFLYRALVAEHAKLESEKRTAKIEKERYNAALTAAADLGARQREHFLQTSTKEQFAIINRDIVTPLKAENASLNSLVHQAAIDRTKEDAEFENTRRALTDLRNERKKLQDLSEDQRRSIDKQALSIQEMTHEIEELHRQPAGPAPPIVYEKLPNDLRINHTVLTTNSGAEPAGVCCFLKEGGQHFFVSSAKALQGEPGDLVIHRGDDGKEYRVGILWAKKGDVAVARLLPGVKRDKKLPQFTPAEGRKGFLGTSQAHVGDKVRVVGRERQSEVLIVTIADTTTATIQGSLTSVSKGAPVIDEGRHLIGFVSDIIDRKYAIVTLIGPAFHIENDPWKLDE